MPHMLPKEMRSDGIGDLKFTDVLPTDRKS